MTKIKHKKYEQVLKKLFNELGKNKSEFDQVSFVIDNNLPIEWLNEIEWCDYSLCKALEYNNIKYIPHDLLVERLKVIKCCDFVYNKDSIPLIRPQFPRICALCIEKILDCYPDMTEELRPFFTTDKVKNINPEKFYLYKITRKCYSEIFDQIFNCPTCHRPYDIK